MSASSFPERTCVGCFQQRNPSDLLRVVRSPQGEVHVQPRGTTTPLPGRGVYVCPNVTCATRATTRKGKMSPLAYALKKPVDESILAQIFAMVNA